MKLHTFLTGCLLATSALSSGLVTTVLAVLLRPVQTSTSSDDLFDSLQSKIFGEGDRKAAPQTVGSNCGGSAFAFGAALASFFASGIS
jgi:hypothetical protein